jgi:dGTP triphosphohydrolase
MVFKLKTKAEKEFEEASARIKEELADKDEDELEEFVKQKFHNVRHTFNTKLDELQQLVMDKKPKKPKREDFRSEEEWVEADKQYKDEAQNFKEFVTWVSTITDRILQWLTDLFKSIQEFFRKLWNWIKQKFQQVSTKVKEFIEFVGSKFKGLVQFVFGG